MKAIETLSCGVTYRSRLEARWSVVFDAMGWSYTYEPEGWNHDGRAYLPDFYVDELKAYLAIKPRSATEAMRKALAKDIKWQRDAFFNGELLWVIEGDPVPGRYRVIVPTVLNDDSCCDMLPEELPWTTEALRLAMAEHFNQQESPR
jgi:hypothetical protein